MPEHAPQLLQTRLAVLPARQGRLCQQGGIGRVYPGKGSGAIVSKYRPRKPKGVSLSTVRRVDRIIRAGLHSTKRALSATNRRALAERLDYAR